MSSTVAVSAPSAPVLAGRTEFRCACGYGIVVSRPLPACPMCHGDAWEQIAAAPVEREGAKGPEATNVAPVAWRSTNEPVTVSSSGTGSG
jgi:hypothetical protein